MSRNADHPESPEPAQASGPTAPPATTSRTALASLLTFLGSLVSPFVVALGTVALGNPEVYSVGLCLGQLLFLGGLATACILGIVGIVAISRGNSALKGTWMAVVAIVGSVVTLVLGLPLLGVLIFFSHEIKDWVVPLWAAA